MVDSFLAPSPALPLPSLPATMGALEKPSTMHVTTWNVNLSWVLSPKPCLVAGTLSKKKPTILAFLPAFCVVRREHGIRFALKF
jgi:hypothetical protein